MGKAANKCLLDDFQKFPEYKWMLEEWRPLRYAELLLGGQSRQMAFKASTNSTCPSTMPNLLPQRRGP